MSKLYNPALPHLFSAKRRNAKLRATCANFALYERRKSEWAQQNMTATQAEYDAAMHLIARECGV